MAYEKQTWNDGDIITKEKLTHIEEGIANSGGGGSDGVVNFKPDFPYILRISGNRDDVINSLECDAFEYEGYYYPYFAIKNFAVNINSNDVLGVIALSRESRINMRQTAKFSSGDMWGMSSIVYASVSVAGPPIYVYVDSTAGEMRIVQGTQEAVKEDAINKLKTIFMSVATDIGIAIIANEITSVN